VRSAQILLVEDNPGDVVLLREALREGGLPHRLHVAGNGAAARAFLHSCGGSHELPMPDLVFLDLNLPDATGHELLAEVRADPRTTALPVAILTSSYAEREVAESYRLHANCHITKPSSLDQLMYVMRQIEEFWFRVAALPALR
jgi:chemotaxis family two-component system response regulator Rcp1